MADGPRERGSVLLTTAKWFGVATLLLTIAIAVLVLAGEIRPDSFWLPGALGLVAAVAAFAWLCIPDRPSLVQTTVVQVAPAGTTTIDAADGRQSDRLSGWTTAKLRRWLGIHTTFAVVFGLVLLFSIVHAFTRSYGYVPVDAILWTVAVVGNWYRAVQYRNELRRRESSSSRRI